MLFGILSTTKAMAASSCLVITSIFLRGVIGTLTLEGVSPTILTLSVVFSIKQFLVCQPGNTLFFAGRGGAKKHDDGILQVCSLISVWPRSTRIFSLNSRILLGTMD